MFETIPNLNEFEGKILILARTAYPNLSGKQKKIK